MSVSASQSTGVSTTHCHGITRHETPKPKSCSSDVTIYQLPDRRTPEKCVSSKTAAMAAGPAGPVNSAANVNQNKPDSAKTVEVITVDSRGDVDPGREKVVQVYPLEGTAFKQRSVPSYPYTNLNSHIVPPARQPTVQTIAQVSDF